MAQQKPSVEHSDPELSETELNSVTGGTDPKATTTTTTTTTNTSGGSTNADVVGGALTAGKVAVPWA